MTSRRLLAALVTVLASMAMFVTLLAYYANRVVVNPDSFSARAVSVVRTGSVESLIVTQVTDRLVGGFGDQTSVTPLIENGVRQALSDSQVTAAIGAAARSLQSELVSGTANSLTLTLPDLGSSIASTIASRNPELAAAIRNIGTVTVVDVRIPSTDAAEVHDLATVGADSVLLLVLSVALVLLALILAPNRRRTLIGLGLGAVAAGALVAAAYLVGQGLVVQEFASQDARTAARTAWSVYLSGLETWGFVLAGIGAVIAAAAALARAGDRHIVLQ